MRRSMRSLGMAVKERVHPAELESWIGAHGMGQTRYY